MDSKNTQSLKERIDAAQSLIAGNTEIGNSAFHYLSGALTVQTDPQWADTFTQEKIVEAYEDAVAFAIKHQKSLDEMRAQSRERIAAAVAGGTP